MFDRKTWRLWPLEKVCEMGKIHLAAPLISAQLRSAPCVDGNQEPWGIAMGRCCVDDDVRFFLLVTNRSNISPNYQGTCEDDLPFLKGGICDPSLEGTLSYSDLDCSGFFSLKFESRNIMGHWHGWFVPSGGIIKRRGLKKCWCDRRSDFCFTFAKSISSGWGANLSTAVMLENPPCIKCNKLANFQSLPCNDQLGKVGCIHGREHWPGLKRSDTCVIIENMCKYNTSTLLFI